MSALRQLRPAWLVGRTVVGVQRTGDRAVFSLDNGRTMGLVLSATTWSKPAPCDNDEPDEREWTREFRRGESIVTARVYCGEEWTWCLSEAIACVDERSRYSTPWTAKTGVREWLEGQGYEATSKVWVPA